MLDQDYIVVPACVLGFEISNNLPALIGTHRQIAWARLIRHELMMEAQAMKVEATDTSAEEAQVIQAAVEWLRGQLDVNFWIDHRDCRDDPLALLTKVAAKMEEWAQMERQSKAEAAAILGSQGPAVI